MFSVVSWNVEWFGKQRTGETAADVAALRAAGGLMDFAVRDYQHDRATRLKRKLDATRPGAANLIVCGDFKSDGTDIGFHSPDITPAGEIARLTAMYASGTRMRHLAKSARRRRSGTARPVPTHPSTSTTSWPPTTCSSPPTLPVPRCKSTAGTPPRTRPSGSTTAPTRPCCASRSPEPPDHHKRVDRNRGGTSHG